MHKLALAFLATAALSYPALAQQPHEAQQGSSFQQQSSGQQWQSGQMTAQGLVSADDLSEQEMRDLQQNLGRIGFDAGDVDGIWGPNTREALANFQRQQGLDSTGELDRPTLSALGMSIMAEQNLGGQDQHDTNPGAMSPEGMNQGR